MYATRFSSRGPKAWSARPCGAFWLAGALVALSLGCSDSEARQGDSGLQGVAGALAGAGAGALGGNGAPAGTGGVGFAGGAGDSSNGGGLAGASGAFAGAGGAAAGAGGAAGVSGGGGTDGTPIVCNAQALAPGDTSETLQHDGQTREYLVHVPASYDGSAAVPLVIDIHGLTSSATAQKGLSGWTAKSDEVGFVLVHPQGLGNSWNGGDLCCGSSQSSGVDDEGFMRAIVTTMSAKACIDPKRVYATGLSNGGAMSHLLACRAADVFAATAPVSMGNGTRPCEPSRPISVILFRGTTDTLVSYNGGAFPSAQADFDQWKMLDACSGQPADTHGVCKAYTGCAAGTEVTLCTINGGHVLYSAAESQGAPVPDVVWEAFERQALP